jgi:hypothetical protein
LRYVRILNYLLKIMAKVALYILGTSHTLQCASAGVENSKVISFEAELHRVCKVHSIARIAEEMSDAGLTNQGVDHTVGAQVAEKLGIHHHNVDLTPQEREELYLGDCTMLNVVMGGRFPDGGKSFRRAFDVLGNDVRERCWIGSMLARKEWPTLFICGADHSKSVEQLWISLGLQVTIEHTDYEP